MFVLLGSWMRRSANSDSRFFRRAVHAAVAIGCIVGMTGDRLKTQATSLANRWVKAHGGRPSALLRGRVDISTAFCRIRRLSGQLGLALPRPVPARAIGTSGTHSCTLRQVSLAEANGVPVAPVSCIRSAGSHPATVELRWDTRRASHHSSKRVPSGFFYRTTI